MRRLFKRKGRRKERRISHIHSRPAAEEEERAAPRPERPDVEQEEPAQQDENRITTTADLFRSWSLRTSVRCLPGRIQSLTEEVADDSPGDWGQVYRKELLDLFEQEIACDVAFRVVGAGHDTLVRAHRCILYARHCELFIGRKKSPPHSSKLDEEIVVDDNVFTEHPEYLRSLIGVCYGVEPDYDARQALVESGHLAEATSSSSSFSLLSSSCSSKLSIFSDLMEIDPITMEDFDDDACMPDVCIIGSAGASPNSEEDWQVDSHIAILCAHSEYFCAALTHQGWSSETSTGGERKRLLRLDSDQFTYDTVVNLVSACYGRSWKICDDPLETLLQLIDGATYLGMKAVSLWCEDSLAMLINATNLPDIMEFAQDNGAQRLLVECHKYLCRNLGSIREAGSLKQLKYSQLEAMLQSDFIETPEDEILEAVLAWSEETAASYDETKNLLLLVRLPFVPVDSSAMTMAVANNLVNEDMVRVCRLFQTDGDYRVTMINSQTMYRPRKPTSITSEIEVKLKPRLEVPDRVFRMIRMLGTVNGRENFHKISSVQFNESGENLVCSFPQSKTFPSNSSFCFDGLETSYMPTANDVAEQRVDREVLQNLPVEDVRQLLAAMLQRENELRLHPDVQSEFGRIGEDECELSRFVAELQAHVASEFNVDANVGIELIRSASTLFPEIAQLAHYVRHNRCFEGSLRVGDKAPDVKLCTLAGEPTTLWTKLDLQQQSSKPVLVVGASYT